MVVTLSVPDLSNDRNLGKAIIRGRRGRKRGGRRWSRTECQSVRASGVSRCTGKSRTKDLQRVRSRVSWWLKPVSRSVRSTRKGGEYKRLL